MHLEESGDGLHAILDNNVEHVAIANAAVDDGGYADAFQRHSKDLCLVLVVTKGGFTKRYMT